MTTAFVLSGGASLGSVQVGMLGALAEAGIAPDLVVGASVGAVNGAWVAADPTVPSIERLAGLWRGLRRQDVFPAQPMTGFLGFFGQRPNLVPDTGLRRLLAANLGFERLEDAAVPVHVVATEIATGADVLLGRGPAVDAVLASAAIPGVFPPVSIDGRTLVDGGVVNNTPISHAVALGADQVYVLSTGYACALERPPSTPLGLGLQALSLLVQSRLAADVDRYEGVVDLRVLPAPCPIDVAPTDFSATASLIERSREQAVRWLRAPRRSPGQADLLAPHPHRHARDLPQLGAAGHDQ